MPVPLSGTLSNGSAFSGTAPTITVNVSPSVNTSYAIATLTNGTCTSTAADLSGIATITVNAKTNRSLKCLPTAICTGGSTNLTITATGSKERYFPGTLSDGTVFSGTAPTITVAVRPSSYKLPIP